MKFEQIELFERWLPVVGYEGLYEVSDWGRVRSVARKCTKGKLLNLQAHKGDGYLQIGLTQNRRVSTFKIHRLVCEAFLGPCPAGKQIDHINGDRINNTLVNLRYVTGLENRRAAVARRGEWAHLLQQPYGEADSSAKLTNCQVTEVRRLSLEGMSQRSIAKEFGISQTTVSKIVRGEARRKG